MNRSLLRLALAILLGTTLSACAVPGAPVKPGTITPALRADTSWAFENSDIPVDPAFRFRRLDNGVRLVIRRNILPKGTILVRMEVSAGSLDETDDERGFAHFVEHMAFNGSTNVPEGEMLPLLERQGLAFGADTNAFTGFEQTTYVLNLPNNDPNLLKTAIMLMREAASELSFNAKALERERGVILAEMRARNDWSMRNSMAQAQFFNPDAHYTDRFPIGTTGAIEAATSESLKAFWQRHYVPEKTSLVIIGDIDPDIAEDAARHYFESWAPASSPEPVSGGPVDPADHGRTATYLDPALSERIIAARHGPWLYEPDTMASRRENILRSIGYAIINRRLLHIARQSDAPFRGAGFGTGEVFDAGRTTRLIVDTADGHWPEGLKAAVYEYRRALGKGFTKEEVAEQVANLLAAAQNRAASADTRTNTELVASAFALLRQRLVPSDPRASLYRLETFIPNITPKSVLGALKRGAVSIDHPLIRFQGRRAPEGGNEEIRRIWDTAMRTPLPVMVQSGKPAFDYTNFGPAGEVIADQTGPLGIRQIRYANGATLNLRRTSIQKNQILVRVGIDGGKRLDTRENPLATAMFSMLPSGGLGRISQDDLQSALAGHVLSHRFTTSSNQFTLAAQTTPDDLELQLQLLGAYVTDPGYRPEGEVQYRLQINSFFARKDATPQSALSNAAGGILTDNDPRFTLSPVTEYRKLTFARLRDAIADRLGHGAIEIAIVGDIDEDQTIAAVARTFAALPAREASFHTLAAEPARTFTSNLSPRTVYHTGPADQALLQLIWHTRDDRDPVETIRLSLLEKVVRIAITERLRMDLGKIYSASASSHPSHTWQGYGTFSVSAALARDDLESARASIQDVIEALMREPVSADLLQRARQPMIEQVEKTLTTNHGWITLAAKAQSEPDIIARFEAGADRLKAITPSQLMETARAYLSSANALEIRAISRESP